MYAVIETGGKQYRVEPGQRLRVERLSGDQDGKITLDRVLLVVDGDDVRIGAPTVPGAQVRCSVVGEVRGEKIIVFRYKSKVRYRRKTGHRQKYTELAIDDIALGSG